MDEPEVVQSLLRHEEGPPRQQFAKGALRVGVLAIQQASGHLDIRAIEAEGNRLLESLRAVLDHNAARVTTEIGTTLKTHFDPTDGKLSQRLDRLVRDGGELESLILRNLTGEDSRLTRTLDEHIGKDSPLLRLLSPDAADGLMQAIHSTVETALAEQRNQVLGQFSLDRKDSALSRFVEEVTGSNGRLRAEIGEDMQSLRSEFSLDNENGALARLVRRVEAAQQAITAQFSSGNEGSAIARITKLLELQSAQIQGNLTLDQEGSALARLRRELLAVVEQVAKANDEFQGEIRAAVEALRARREAVARTTAGGRDFETEVGEYLQRLVSEQGHVYEATGNTTGKIPRCKRGDHVITLGTDSAAAGARLVCESKDEQGLSVAGALAELDEAMPNREASVGMFVFSRRTCPQGVKPLSRHGERVLLVWDQDDPTSDIFLETGFSLALALAVKQRAQGDARDTDTAAAEQAIEKALRTVEHLGDISTWATTIKSNSVKILERMDKSMAELQRQLEVLQEHVESLRAQPLGAGRA